MFFVYFLKSRSNGDVYVGSTGQIPEARLKQHNLGSNQWTRNNGFFDLIYYEAYVCIEDAHNREIFYKSGFGRKVRDAIIGVAQFPPEADKG